MATFRPATGHDVSEILKITQISIELLEKVGNKQWNSEYPTRVHFEQDISDGTLWVAEIGEQIAGFVALTIDQPDEYREVGWDTNEICIVPHRLAVAPEFRGLGIAQDFMKLAEKISKERGCRQVRVDTNEVNSSMRRVFEKLGL